MSSSSKIFLGKSINVQGSIMSIASTAIVNVDTGAVFNFNASTLNYNGSTLTTKAYVDGVRDKLLENLDTPALDSLNEVVAAFQSADSGLTAAISSMQSAALSATGVAGTSLESRITSEVTRATSAEEVLTTRVSGAEASLTTRVSGAEN